MFFLCSLYFYVPLKNLHVFLYLLDKITSLRIVLSSMSVQKLENEHS